MKPPSRTRIKPARFLDIKKAEPRSRFRPGCNGQELRGLIIGLKQQKRSKSELDFLALRKKVPKWSLLQIQNLIKSLKKCVVQRMYLQVQKQAREEQKNKGTIELWSDLAQKMAGVHKKTISSAFSQMLVVAATEPCSLRHSEPSRTTDSQIPLASGLRTVPLRPMPKSPVIILPGRASKKNPVSHENTDATSNFSAQTSTVMSPSHVAKEKQRSELQQKNKADKDPAMPSTSGSPELLRSQPALKPTPPVPASSAVSSAAPLRPPDTDQPDKQAESQQSEQTRQYRPTGMKSVVDFEKIYQFMSNIIHKTHTEPLTAMESAVLLDLLMSLPEELPLLDCKELQHHLLQVHARLNMPAARSSTDQGPAAANSALAEVTKQQNFRPDQLTTGPGVSLQTQSKQSTEEENVQKGAVTKQVKATGSSLTAGDFASQLPAIKLSKDKGDWATAGLCPLNPFMVPIALLKRQ